MLKNKRNIITASLLAFVLTAMIFVACEKSDVTPMEQTSGVLDKKGGNGGGGNPNNPNTPGYNPCAGYVYYPVVNQNTAFPITIDTTYCGLVRIDWDPQPGYTSVIDSCNTLEGRYYVSFANVGHNNGCNGGTVSYTDGYVVQMGLGCSVFPGYEYRVSVGYYVRDNATQTTYYRYSTSAVFRAGYRAPFLGNC